MAELCRTRPEPWAPFAADLARLEWAVVEVIHAPSDAGLSADALAAIPAERWQTARLVASRTLRLLSFDYPANDYYQAFRDGRMPALPERRSSSAAVCRRGLPVTRTDLEPDAALLLEDLVAGFPLQRAVRELERRAFDPASVAHQLPGWLGCWVSSGFFSAIEY
jgi:hypothetical protein